MSLGILSLGVVLLNNALQTKIITNTVDYLEYQTPNVKSQMVSKILTDNTVKETLPHMFNYTSNGNIIEDLEYYDMRNDPEYITNGLYQSEDEDGVIYYYRGNVDNNYVQFGEYEEDYYVYRMNNSYYQTLEICEEQIYNESQKCVKTKLASAGDKIYWRIIRTNGDGSLRLIYDGTNNDSNMYWPFNSRLISKSHYNNMFIDGEDDSKNPKYMGYTYDNGIASKAKEEVDTWYNNVLGKSTYDKKIALTKFCNDMSQDTSGTDYVQDNTKYTVSKSLDRLGQSFLKSISQTTKDNTPSLICASTTENYNLKAGLITADELVMAGNNLFEGDNYLIIENDSFWTMTPAYLIGKDNEEVVYTENDLFLLTGNQLTFLPGNNGYNDSFVGIRPVISLSKDVTITGTGTKENPYKVTDPNKYEGMITIEEGNNSDIPPAFKEDVPLDKEIIWTSDDETISKIENNKILGLKEGQTIIRGISSDGLSSYEIKVTVLKNPETISTIYIATGITIILILGTITYVIYQKIK